MHHMPHVSKIKLNKQAEEKLINSLETVFTKISKKDEMSAFLLSLMTHTEKLMLAKRLAVIILLKEGLSQTDIANSLHLTRDTVFKLSLLFETKQEGYDIALRILKEEKMLSDFKDILMKLAGYTIRASGGYIKPSIV